MKKTLRVALGVFVISFMTLSCKSNSAYLKEAAVKLNKLAEAMSDTKYEAEFDRLVADYNKFMKNLPSSIQEMSEDEIVNINGGNEYLEALEFFNQVYMGKSRYFTFAEYDQSVSLNEPVVASNSSIDDASNVLKNTEPEPEDEYILKPGVTYITASSATDTNEFGERVSLNMEFTIYKDGSATGNIIETTEANSYGNRNSYNHPVEGKWKKVSKHDKRFLEIKLILEGDEYYNWFYYYVDEEHNAYANDINTKPLQLIEK